MNWRAEVTVSVGRLTLEVNLVGDASPTALIGPNGSGKTTLMRTIAGAHSPVSGHIQLGDRVVYDSVSGIDLPPEDRRVGYVPQGYGLFPHLRVIDNVAFGWKPGAVRRDGERGRAAAAELLERLACPHLAHRWPESLSGGEQQRVALARALMIDPQILLLDEPLSAMDATARRGLRRYLAEHLAARGAPALVVTQDARDVIALEATVFVLEGGRIVQRGSAAELAAGPATEFVAEFFGAA